MTFSQGFGQAAQFYDQMDPQQRQTAVQQFQQHFSNSGDPQLQQQAQALDPNNPDPQQLGQLHDYAQQAAPDALNRVMDHPDIRSAMSQQGVTDWGGGQDPGQQYQSQPYQDQQGGGFGGQGGYSDRDAGYQQGSQYDQPDQYRQDQAGEGGQGGYQQDPGGGGDQYGQDDPSQQNRGGYRDRGEGDPQGGQYDRPDSYQQDQRGY